MGHDQAPAQAGTAADADEDELDELDDVLDEFADTAVDRQDRSGAASAPPSPPRTDDAALDAPDDDFSRQFEAELKAGLAEVESLLTGLDAGAGTSAGTSAGAGASAAAAVPASPAAADSFQDTIRRTMERMQESSEAATSATATGTAGTAGAGEDDILAQLMREMEATGFAGAGPGAGPDAQTGTGTGTGTGSADADADGGLDTMLAGMMEQLIAKEVLYEPIKELHDKYPDWLASKRSGLPGEQLQKYEAQQQAVAKMVHRFESKEYSDDSPADMSYILDQMQKMQAAGSPPADIVGDMGSAQDMLSELDTGCPAQ